ncbi:hypothetical protein TKK_0000707 [Trichogramma kaykai]
MEKSEDSKLSNDEFLSKIWQHYYPSLPEEVQPPTSIEKLDHEKRRCLSLKNSNVQEGWQKFVNDLPKSQNEIIPTPSEQFWRFKMYKKYCPEEPRTDFRKTMKSGPGFDKYGSLPLTAEDARLFRSSPKNHKY